MKNYKNKFFISNLFCMIYFFVGIILWIICFKSTDYSILNGINNFIGCDGPISQLWDIHDKKWLIYDIYAWPFIILTLPVYDMLGCSVSEGKCQFVQYDIVKLYLIFIPIFLLKLIELLKRKINN